VNPNVESVEDEALKIADCRMRSPFYRRSPDKLETADITDIVS
jgi:hypothetical protein